MNIDYNKEEYYEDDYDEDDKISFSKDMPQDLIRPYTDTSNKLIVLMMNVNGYNANKIAYILKRDPIDVARHIVEMKADGMFARCHKEMMMYNGMYRYQILKKPGKLKKAEKTQKSG